MKKLIIVLLSFLASCGTAIAQTPPTSLPLAPQITTFNWDIDSAVIQIYLPARPTGIGSGKTWKISPDSLFKTAIRLAGNATYWSLTGNSGTNTVTNFLGTTDDKPLMLRLNNTWYGKLNVDSNLVFLGQLAGYLNTGFNNINALGWQAAEFNSGFNVNALGNQAAAGNTGTDVNALGFEAANNNTGSHVEAWGNSAAQGNSYNKVVAIGDFAEPTDSNQFFLSDSLHNFHAKLNGGANGTVLTNDGSGNGTWQSGGGSGWGLTGNAGTSTPTNFIGTTDANGFNIATNDTIRSHRDSLGRELIPQTIYIQHNFGGATLLTLKNDASITGSVALHLIGKPSGVLTLVQLSDQGLSCDNVYNVLSPNLTLFGEGVNKTSYCNIDSTHVTFNCDSVIFNDSVRYIHARLNGITNGNVLTEDASGNWTSQPPSGGGSGTVTSIATTSPITGGTITTTGTIGITQATTSTNGYLSSTDWNTFNGKGSGTVTSVATGNFLTGGTITTSGTILADTTKLHSFQYLKGQFYPLVGNPSSFLTGNQTITLSGDVTGSGTTAITTAIKSNVALAGNPTTTTQTPLTNNTTISTTAYTDAAVAAAVQGVNPAVAVQAATTTVLPAVTCANGVSGIGATLTQTSAAILTIDGYTPILGDRLLIKNQATASQNGIYNITTLGTSLIPFVLTRASDFNSTSDINSTGAIPVINGTVNGTTQWVVSSTITSVACSGAGTSITFTQFSANPANNITTSTSAGGDLTGTYPNPTISTSSAAISWVKISSQTASNSATIDFANVLTSSYTTYEVVVTNAVSSTNNNTVLLMRQGTGSTPTYQTTSYINTRFVSQWNETAGNNSTGSAGAASGAGVPCTYIESAGTYNSVNAIITITNPSQSTGMHMYMVDGVDNFTTSGGTTVTNRTTATARISATTAVTSLRFLFDGSNIASGTFTLYGLK